MLSVILIMLFMAVSVQRMLRRDFDKGLALAVFYLVLSPNELLIPLPGALPELNGQRVILLLLLLNHFSTQRYVSFASVSGILRLLCLIGVARIASTVFTAVDSAASFKIVLSFLLETVLFFFLVATGLRTHRSIYLVAGGSLAALVMVAGLAMVEKYTDRNLVAMLIPGTVDDYISVTATFRHRILLGFAMALGFPLALALADDPESKLRRRLAWLGLLVIPAACYFANSRGPWVACALAGGVMWLLGSRGVRRKLMLAGVLATLVLLLRPGTFQTIQNLWEQSFGQDTVKGHSTSYRLKLWTVASTELAESFGTLLLGYGGRSTELLDLSEYFDQGTGGTTAGLGHTSWDSQFASNFMQYGYLGFGLEVLLFLVVLHRVYRTWQESEGQDKDFAAALVAIALVFCWAMLVVAIFNAQLYYFFWTFVAVAGRLRAVESPGAMTAAIEAPLTPEAVPMRNATPSYGGRG